MRVDALLAVAGGGMAASEAGLAAFFAFSEGLEADRAALLPLAQQGSARAQLDLGLNLLYGGPSGLTRQAAARWLGLAADQGLHPAAEALAMVRAMDGPPPADAAGRRLYARGLRIRAVTLQGLMTPSPDPVAWLLVAAAMGDAAARAEATAPPLVAGGGSAGLALAVARAEVLAARHGPAGLEEAIALVERACRAAAAVHARLAVPALYLAPQPPAEAPPDRAAAEAGDPAAMAALAEAHDPGGPLEHPAEAAAWWRRAAEAGVVAAAARLAHLHETGWGVPPDPAEARRWRVRAAEGGDARAAIDLAMGAIAADPPDLGALRSWLAPAAEADVLAAYLYARVHQHGLGGEADPAMARRYATLAAEAGLDAARALLTELSNPARDLAGG